MSTPPTAPHAPIDATPKPLRAGGASLDVMRFLAAGFILLFHYGVTAPTPLGELFPVFGQGWIATDFFLVLSGFILSRAYGKRLTEGRMRPWSFWVKRVARFWPSHIVMLLAMAALAAAATVAGHGPDHAERYDPLLFVYQFFLIHSWGVTATPSWNIPTWTLSALIVCYAAFSLYVRHVYNRPQWQLLLGLIAVLWVGNGLAAGLTGRALVDLPFEWGVLRALPLFIIGSLLDRLSVNLRISQRFYAVGMAASLTLIVVLASVPRQTLSDDVILSLLSLIIVLSAGVSFKETHLTHRMGRASLSLFLTHSFVGAVGFGVREILISRLGVGTAGQWALWGLTVVGAIIAAFIFDALIDKPLSERVAKLKWIRTQA